MGKDLEEDLEEPLLPDELVFRSNPFGTCESGYTGGVSSGSVRKLVTMITGKKNLTKIRKRLWMKSILDNGFG